MTQCKKDKYIIALSKKQAKWLIEIIDLYVHYNQYGDMDKRSNKILKKLMGAKG